MPLEPGQTLSHYRLVEKIGEGGMGVVWKAEDTRLRRPVALKLLPAGFLADRDRRERFLREARTAAAVSHPGIATIHEVDEVDGVIFIAMEFVEGTTLRGLLGDGPMPVAEMLRLATELAEGLAEAHRAQVIHRDLKPDNVMVATNTHVKILDFGLAKLVHEHRQEIAAEPTKLTTISREMTREGRTLGTPAYMSPEQALGQPLDARTDVFSLGVVLYEMATGTRPFTGDTWTALADTILHGAPAPPRSLNPEIPRDLARIIGRCLEKDREARYPSAREVLADLKRCGAARAGWSRRTRIITALAAGLAVVVIAAAGAWYSRVRWARTEAIAEIERLVEEANGRADAAAYAKAFQIATRAERYIGDDPELQAAFARCSNAISPLAIETDPPGARVSVKNYADPEADWRPLGQTPLREQRLPLGYYAFRMEKPGFATVEAVVTTWPGIMAGTLRRKLDPVESIPTGTVRVAGGTIEAIGGLPDFFLDRLEVTNAQFKAFVSAGGYRDAALWRHPFVEGGNALSWEEAMARFRDTTGRPGPAAWQAGDFPEGQGDLPVGGISWYEAAAYCEFAGKSLPTAYHWAHAASPRFWYKFGFGPILYRLSNLAGRHPAPVGRHQGMTAFGALDMAGNVREWCWNATSQGRAIRGGAWDDVPYMYLKLSQQSPWNRAPQNGVRCVAYPDAGEVPAAAFDQVELSSSHDYRKDVPVDDAVFAAYRSRFDYDPSGLEARIEDRDESEEDWVREKVTLNAAYDDKRIIAYLYLPRGAPPPYQTVVFFPHDGVWGAVPFDEYPFGDDLDFFVKSGRAAVYPIYLGAHERSGEMSDDDWEPYNYANLVVKWTKDFRRVVDYLETRADVDADRIAYYGISRGGILGGIIPAVEDRIGASMLVLGGFGGDRPEASPVSYLPRITVPTLMLNGRLDPGSPVETELQPFYDLLGTPGEDKRLILYDTDHYIAKREMIKECLAWLDRYFGPVR